MDSERVPRKFAPRLSDSKRCQLIELLDSHSEAISRILRDVALHTCENTYDDLAFKASAHILADLAEQSWEIWSEDNEIWVLPPQQYPTPDESVLDVKRRLRQGLQVARDRQLAEPSVSAFIRKMEHPRPFGGRLVSIQDLIDDGLDLAKTLSRMAPLEDQEALQALGDVIRPTLVVCTQGSKCPHTGFALQDIWRYFRHTWSLEYRPSPGRTLQVLIRNEARPNAPIMGIAMLSSPCSRMKVRDEWIGWTIESLEDRIRDGSWQPDQVARSLFSTLNQSISEIRFDDLINPSDLEQPTPATIRRLRMVAKRAEETRLKALREGGGVRRPLSADSDESWLTASEQPLFVRKRANTLAALLSAKAQFLAAGVDNDCGAALLSLLKSKNGRAAVEVALAEIRKRGLASGLLDVSVCGAVPPYNELLGGKLVALLLASREMQEEYQARYASQVSLIASQLAGRKIVRPARILVLTTTSLYGVGSSQYNRLSLRSSDNSGHSVTVSWKRLGLTSGYGTAHMSRWTVESLVRLSILTRGIRRVNNVFGEGSSPRLRQIREGLEVLGLDGDTILRHETPRIVYACEPVEHGRERLMGISQASLPSQPTVADLSQAWCRRWLLKRIRNKEVLERLSRTSKQLFFADAQSVDAP